MEFCRAKIIESRSSLIATKNQAKSIELNPRDIATLGLGLLTFLKNQSWLWPKIISCVNQFNKDQIKTKRVAVLLC